MEPIPARMINEVCYCPRLFALEHMAGEWADNEHTIEGRTVHRRVDAPTHRGLPEPGDDPDSPQPIRRVHLGDPDLGMVAIIDLVEIDGQRVVPIDYKKGSAPDMPEQAWDPDRVQVCAQALLLRAHGYTVDHAVVYYAASKARIDVPITDQLVAATLGHRDVARAIVESGTLPPPLINSPKCDGCSLVGICLPDEHHLLTHQREGEVRPLIPSRDDGVPLHVQARYGSLRLRDGEVHVYEGSVQVGKVRLNETSQIVLWGNVSVTTPLMHELAKHGIPLSLHSFGGWYHTTIAPVVSHNVLSRIAQHAVAADPARALIVARRLVAAKIKNQRTLLRRNGRDVPADALAMLKSSVEQALIAPDADTLRGIEGFAARTYFEHFSLMIRADLADTFHFDGRNRRPPRDPVNCLLSFTYACLARECTLAGRAVGLDTHVGFLHTPRAGRPALALDLMEEFRPVIADSIVLNAINNGVVQASDFRIHPTGVMMEDDGRKRLLRVLERRLDEITTHPTLTTRLSYRRMLEFQARLMAKTVLGEIPEYPPFTVR